MTDLCVVGSRLEPLLTNHGPMRFFQASWVCGHNILTPGLQDPNKFTILDCQHISEGSVDKATSEQIKMAYLLTFPDEVVIPDDFRNSQATLDNITYFHRMWKIWGLAHPRPRFMFVPQGRDFGDWKWCLNDAINRYGDSFQTIGVPKVLESYGVHRVDSEVLELIPPQYAVHMLGVWAGLGEMIGHPRVRSWDTSFPVACAQRGIPIWQLRGGYKIQLDEDVPVMDTELLTYNVQYMQSRLHSSEQLPNWGPSPIEKVFRSLSPEDYRRLYEGKWPGGSGKE